MSDAHTWGMSAPSLPRPRRPGIQGVVTEKHLALAELEFPGISVFYRRVRAQPEPPLTFLDLLARFGAFGPVTRS